MLAGDWDGRRVAVKIYKPTAVLRHARKHAVPLPRYEHERNLAFFRAPGLAPHVAEPLAFIDEPGVSALVQERLDGELYYFRFLGRGRLPEPALVEQLGRIVRLAHEAGLYDVDLHAMNVMVVEGAEGPVARLFDFNLIPFHVRPPNPWMALMLRTGLMDSRARDLRKLEHFHDFGRVERKLLRFYR